MSALDILRSFDESREADAILVRDGISYGDIRAVLAEIRSLTAKNATLHKRIENCVMELDRRASALRSVSDERDALRKDADATRRRQLYELAGYLSVELPELHGVLGGRLVNVVDAYRAKIGDGISPEELT